MKRLSFLSIFIIFLCISQGRKQKPPPSNIQKIDNPRPLNQASVIVDLLAAFTRKDYFEVTLDAIIFYQLAQGPNEFFLEKLILDSFKYIIKKLLPFYYRLFPNKKPKESVVVEGFNKILNNEYVKGAANVYQKVEGPLFNTFKSFLFD